MPLMRRGPLGGLTIKAVLSLGFGLTLILWFVTGYRFTKSMADAEQQAAAIAARYVQAQDLLAALRVHVLASSGTVRDAMLERTAQPLEGSREQLRHRLAVLHGTVASYAPVMDSLGEQSRLEELKAETIRFADGATAALASESFDGTARFRTEVLPLRTAALRATEELQAFNRAAFVEYRKSLAHVHTTVEQSSLRQLGFALLCGLGIAVMATAYAGRLERRLVNQLMENALKTRALQDLSIRMIRAQEDERRRIAHELHDEVGQALTAIKVELSVAQRAIAAAGAVPDSLQSAQAITDGALHTVRDLSQLLHPAVLDDLGLVDAVDSYLRAFSRRCGIRADLVVNGLSSRLPADVEVAAYRMIQESLTNVARHARATRCQVTLRRSADRVEIEIMDDGEGFDAADIGHSGSRTGLGIIGMRERALQLAGVVTVESARGKGTTVRIVLSPDRPSAVTPPDLPDATPVAEPL